MHFMEYDSTVTGFIGKVTDIVILSAVWFLCCVPIFTIGASTVALYYSSVKSIRKEKGYVLKNFFHSFKQNFFPATVLWLFFLIIAILLYFSFIFTNALPDENLQFVMLCFYMFSSFLSIGTACYAFPILSKCSMKIRDILKFSLALTIRHFPISFILVLIWIVAVSVMWFIPLSVFCVPVVFSLLFSFLMEHILIKYTPKNTSAK